MVIGLAKASVDLRDLVIRAAIKPERVRCLVFGVEKSY